MAIAAALAALTRKELSNGPKCLEVGVDLHSCNCGNVWQLGKGGPGNDFKTVIPPGHQHVFP